VHITDMEENSFGGFCRASNFVWKMAIHPIWGDFPGEERTHNVTNSCLSQPCQFLQIGVFNLRSVWDVCLLMAEKCVLMIPHVVHALSTSMELELVWHIIFIDQDPSFMILALSYFQYEMLSIPLFFTLRLSWGSGYSGNFLQI
jgi:hypothetical protein